MNNNSLSPDMAESLVYVGQEFKNFKAFCDYFNIIVPEKVCTNTRKSILKKAGEFFSLEKQGQKLVIKEIIKYPTEKKQLCLDKYILDDFFENQLLLLFKESKRRCLLFRKKELWELLGVINCNYTNDDFVSLNKKANDESLSLDKWMYNHFLERSYFLNDRKVKQTLIHLQNKGLIVFREVLFKADKNGIHQEIVDEDEMSFVLDCRINAKNDVVGKYRKDSHGCFVLDSNGDKIKTTFQDIRKNAEIYTKYKKALNKRLSEKNINYTYQKYKITICGDKFIKEAYEDNLFILCKKVNKVISSIIDKDAERKQLSKYPQCKDYATLQKWLTSQLIKLQEDIEDKDMDEEIEYKKRDYSITFE